jgi:2-oxoglutarate ferredoxin oxidoreductase subunit delta
MIEEKTAKFRVVIYPRWCKKCGICVAFCPKNALGFDSQGVPYLANPAECTGCELCAMMCPDLAVEVFKIEDKEKDEGEKE